MIYAFKAIVYCKKLGKDFGRWAHTTIVANSLEEATKEANASFNKLCITLEKNHKEMFLYGDLTLE